MSTKVLALVGILGVLGGIGVPTAYSQAPDSTIGAQVERAVHGPDGQGRDGPMATLDRPLIVLYYEYRAYQQGAEDGGFSPSSDQLPVHDAHVTVDAIAKETPAVLLDSLRAHGLQDGAQAQRLVSGRLPLASLRKAAGLSLLQSMRVAQSRTNTGNMLPGSSPDPDAEPPESSTSSQQSGSPETVEASGSSNPETDSETDSTGAVGMENGGQSTPRSHLGPSAETETTSETGTTRAGQSDLASPDVSEPVPTDTGEGRSESAEGERWAPMWAYILGGVVILALGLVIGLRRRA